MVKHDIAALIAQLLAAGLDRVFQNLIHARHIRPHGDDSRQILQRALHRIIQAGSHEQEQEQRQHVDAAAQQQHGAGQRHGGDAELQDRTGRGHEHGVRQLRRDRLLFHGTDLPGKAAEIALLCIAGLQVADRFDILLNAVGAGHFHGHGPALHAVLHAIAAEHDGRRYRDDPQRRQRHAPVEEEQAQRDEHRGDERAEQAGNEVRAGLLQHLTVCHDGAGQVGQVALAEEGQRKSAQALGERQAADTALLIGRKVGAVILEPRRQKDQGKAGNAAADIKCGPSRCAARHQVADERIQQARGQHKGDVLRGAGQHAPDESPRALRGACRCSLDLFQHADPSFSTFQRTED